MARMDENMARIAIPSSAIFSYNESFPALFTKRFNFSALDARKVLVLLSSSDIMGLHQRFSFG